MCNARYRVCSLHWRSHSSQPLGMQPSPPSPACGRPGQWEHSHACSKLAWGWAAFLSCFSVGLLHLAPHISSFRRALQRLTQAADILDQGHGIREVLPRLSRLSKPCSCVCELTLLLGHSQATMWIIKLRGGCLEKNCSSSKGSDSFLVLRKRCECSYLGSVR